MSNLIHNPFGGTLFPISRNRVGVLGIKAYPALAAVPWPVELAIVATPAPTVPEILGECAAAGVKGAIVLSSGFGDTGPAGVELENQIRTHRRSLRILGPNSLGIACPRTGFNATFAPAMVPAGNVGFLSQSGGILTGLLHKDSSQRIGCSTFVSVGSLLDIGWPEWIDYLAEDPHSECLAIYLETLQNAQSFFSAVRQVTPHKPVVLIKGREDRTGSSRAPDELFEEACRRSGALLVHKIADFFRMAEVLTKQPRPKGRGLTIVTNARSVGLLAADTLQGEGGQLSPLAPQTVSNLGQILASRWNQQNPIDVGDDATLERYTHAVAIAMDDPNTDALLAVLAPHATIDPFQAAEKMCAFAGQKPIFACWMWGAADSRSLNLLQEAGIPNFRSPEAAIRVFGYLSRHHESLSLLRNDSGPMVQAERAGSKEVAAQIVSQVRSSGRTVLSEAEHERLLAAYGLPMLKTRWATSQREAVQIAEVFEYRAVLALLPEQGRHEMGMIELRARGAAAVQRAFHSLELIAREYFRTASPIRVRIQPLIDAVGFEVALASKIHRELGHVIQCGVGGHWASLSRDRMIALPPLTLQMARQMIKENYLFKALRSTPEWEAGDFELLPQYLTAFSRLVLEQRWIKEVTINPLLVSPERVIALNAHVVLHDLDVQQEHLPVPAFGIE
jgi:acetyltransferase